MPSPVILWFQQDLRLQDHAALAAAAASGRPIIPLYIYDDESPGPWTPGGAARWWLHHSLAALRATLNERGSDLVLRRGAAARVLPQVLAETGSAAVFVTRRYEPDAAAQEGRLAKALRENGIDFRRFPGGLLFEPESIATKDGTPFKVFTPFYKACLAKLPEQVPIDVPESIAACSPLPHSMALEELGLLPRAPDWAAGLRATWTAGEKGGQARLDDFLDGAMAGYRSSRDRPDMPGTSRISPHLHFGELSPRQVWHRARFAMEMTGAEDGCTAFLRELLWREFSYHLLHHWPSLPDRPFRSTFARFPWHDDPAALKAWQRGETGYPIVDAGMRQLWHSGWMHNRVRMVVASFLVKHLLVPWQAGATWFWDTLVDADLANNSASWQWVTGCGADAAPYFRIFNPMIQGEKFDPDGTYVRQWLPELAALPTKVIHQPWTAPPLVLAEAGVVLGKDYPAPIVDHSAARKRALEAFQCLKDRNT